jgi:hypothetical protein
VLSGSSNPLVSNACSSASLAGIQTRKLAEAAEVEARRLSRKRGDAREGALRPRAKRSRLQAEVPLMRDQCTDLHGASQFGTRISAQDAALEQTRAPTSRAHGHREVFEWHEKDGRQ